MTSICSTTLRDSLKFISKVLPLKKKDFVFVRLHQGTLKVYGKTSYNSSMVAELPVVPSVENEEGDDDFYAKVPWVELLEALDCFPKGHIVSFLCKDSLFHIKGSLASTAVKYSTDENEDDSPFGKNKTGEKFCIPADLFINHVCHTAFAASNDWVKDRLTAIHFSLKELITSVATDGHRLTEVVSFHQKLANLPEASFNITAPSALHIAKFIKGKGCPTDVEVCTSQGKGVSVSFSKDRAKYKYSQADFKEDYPAYQHLIPDSFIHTAEFSGSEFLSAVERAAKVSDKATNVVRINLLPEGGMAIGVEREGFNYSECIDCDYNGDGLLIAFNHKYLTEFLKMPSVKGKRLTFKANAPTTPAILLPVDQSTYRYLVMPIQVRGLTG